MFEQIITFQARYRPEAIAISTPEASVTFAGLDADVDRMAQRLRPLVPARGHVAVQAASPGLHWVILLALARLGCVSTSLPPVGERSEAELLGILQPDFLVTDRQDDSNGCPTLQMRPEWIAETFQAAVQPVAPHVFGPEDPVRIVMSSGTTGAPKKMLLTRRMVDARIKTGGLSQMAHRHLHSVVGLDTETGFRAALVAWATGSPVLYPQAGFRWADFLLGSRPQVLVLVPAQLDMILSSLPTGFPRQRELSLVVISGSPSPALYERTCRQLTSEVFVVYGSTEAGLACQASPWLLQKGEAMTGIVSPSAEVEIVDAAGGSLPCGASGRIRVRTEEMVGGYLDDEALTQTFFKDGWFYPGDLGALSGAGQLTVHGRETEILELGGLRIAPSVIEAILLSCPGVRDAAAFSIDVGGVQQPRAAIVCGPDCDIKVVGGRLASALPQFEVPLFAVEQVPRSDRSKVQRDKLCKITERLQLAAEL